jgi:hypothetical protein
MNRGNTSEGGESESCAEDPAGDSAGSPVPEDNGYRVELDVDGESDPAALPGIVASPAVTHEIMHGEHCVLAAACIFFTWIFVL